MNKKRDRPNRLLFWLKTSVATKKVEPNGRILYDVQSILRSAPARRHIAALHGHNVSALAESAPAKP